MGFELAEMAERLAEWDSEWGGLVVRACKKEPKSSSSSTGRIEEGLPGGRIRAEGARGVGVSANMQLSSRWSSFYEESRVRNSFGSVKKSWAAESDPTRCMRPWQCGQFHGVDAAVESTSAGGTWLSRARQSGNIRVRVRLESQPK